EARVAPSGVAGLSPRFSQSTEPRDVPVANSSTVQRRRKQVHPSDSVLGPLSRWPNPGLTARTYDELVKLAFHERWWRSSKLIAVSPNGSRQDVDKPDDDPQTEEYTLIQYNFTLFFGLAVQMYEATLVSDDTPWDGFFRNQRAKTTA